MSAKFQPYVAPHWPRPYGLGADPITQTDHRRRAGRAPVSPDPVNPIGIGWAGPTILYGGTAEQQDRYLPSDPVGRGLLVPAVQRARCRQRPGRTGTRAVRDGDEYVVNGQKIWTELAQYSRYGILIARTDPDDAQAQGVSYFVCPMDAPGIEIRPIVEMTGGHTFNEVFFTGVRIPAENLIGDEHRRLAPGEGHPRQRTCVALRRAACCGATARRARRCSRSVRADGTVTDP
jgi:3-oxochol-4-en-24-oyl-CoA dehydrogenase